jgi:aryl-alcohol dehydrogenase-like predicted oxidoreductase
VAKEDLMKFTKLGKTDIDVSRIAFGCWAIVGGFNWGDQDKEDSIAALKAAHESGITLFDTAEGYGSGYSEELVAEALNDVRDEIVIATKASRSHHAPSDLKEACEQSLKRLKTDVIELYQLHWPSRDVPFEETFESLEELQNEGKIRAYGVSNFGTGDLSDVVEFGKYSTASNQVAYSLIFRPIEYELQPVCVKEDISILCYSPLMQGLLTGKFKTVDDVPEDRARTRHFSNQRPNARHDEEGAEQETFDALNAVSEISEESGIPMGSLSLAWLLAQDGVGSAIVGGRNPEQVKENVKAADVELSGDVIAQLSQATESVKVKLGSNPDMWQSESRIR